MLNGPRTVDEEFNQKFSQMKDTAQAMSKLESIFTNFNTYMNGFAQLTKDAQSVIATLFSQEQEYSKEGSQMIACQKSIEDALETFRLRITILDSKFAEWKLDFKNATNEANKRESLRKTYDHYDKKIEEFYSKQSKGKVVDESKLRRV